MYSLICVSSGNFFIQKNSDSTSPVSNVPHSIIFSDLESGYPDKETTGKIKNGWIKRGGLEPTVLSIVRSNPAEFIGGITFVMFNGVNSSGCNWNLERSSRGFLWSGGRVTLRTQKPQMRGPKSNHRCPPQSSLLEWKPW